MRSSKVLTQLALFASTTLAFYPYAPDWLKEEWAVEKSIAERQPKGITLEIKQRTPKASTSSPEAVTRHAARLAAKYARLQPEGAVEGSIVKRDNAYTIMEAAETEGEHTTGLNQDGTDYSYFVKVQLGSKNREFYMLVDTGAGSSWIMGSDCQTEACSMHDTFGPEDSDTLEESNTPFSITYGTGVVNGSLATDTLRIAGLSFKYNLGVAGWTSNDFTKFAFDGILGFALSKGANQNLLEALGGSLEKNIFSVALHRATDGPNVGELSLGTINSERHSGKISYTSIGKDHDWAIPLDDMSYDGKKASVGGILSYIDTGTSFIFGPPDVVRKLHMVIPGAETSDGKTWRVPCDSKGPLAFTFSGVSYELSTKDWISPQNNNGKCTSNIYGFEIVQGAWLLGDTFIKNVYTVFDKEQKRIGFAPLVAPTAPSPSSPPTTSKGPDATKAPSSSGTQQATTASSAPSTPTEESSESAPGLVGGGQTAVPEGPADPDSSDPPEGEAPDDAPGSAAPGRLSNTAAYSTILSLPFLLESNDAMPQPRRHGEATTAAAAHDEDQGLLAGAHLNDANDGDFDGDGDMGSRLKGGLASGSRSPRAPGRVRFAPQPEIVSMASRNSTASSGGWSDGERPSREMQQVDYDDPLVSPRGSSQHHHGHHHRIPLLTDIEAPSVTVANSWPGGADDAEDWAEQEMRRPKSGLKSAFMNMANSIIGAGIIGQPYAMRQAGLLAGTALLVGLTVVVDWTICLIVINSKLSGTSSFQGTVEHCFGRAGLITISVAQWVFAFGGMVAFGVIVGDTIPHVLAAVWPGLSDVPVLGLLTDRRVAIAVFVMGVSYPLTLYRDIAKLAKASTFALIGMLIIVVTVLLQGVFVSSDARGSFSTPLLTVNGGIFQAIGVISFAFVCHHNSLLIYGSLKTPTIDNFSRVTHYSTAVSMLACLIMALGGFLTFGDKTLGNVLNNFPADNLMVNVARLCFGLNMLTTLPLEAFVCREVMLTYFFPDEPFNMNRHLLFSTSLVAAATVLSLVTCDLGAVFELVGATSAVVMAYVLPPLCYVKLTTRSWRTYVAYAVAGFGVIVMVISVVQAVGRLMNRESKPPP
ncbi:Vacuolar amino acid transporter [Paramyrothecium foliicola]|nr:Vacuolar amino acid transporter [Paramyrothecium foliicola]